MTTTTTIDDPILAYRAWDVHANGNLLISTAISQTWRPITSLRAECSQTKHLPRHKHHNSPDYDCRCGYYAVKKLEDAPRSLIFGRVALWGEIVEHDTGYRAEYAYPQILFIPPRVSNHWKSQIKQLANIYKCDIAPLPNHQSIPAIPYAEIGELLSPPLFIATVIATLTLTTPQINTILNILHR